MQNDLILKLEQNLNDILDFNPKDQQEAEEIEQLKESLKRQINSLKRQENSGLSTPK